MLILFVEMCVAHACVRVHLLQAVVRVIVGTKDTRCVQDVKDTGSAALGGGGGWVVWGVTG